MKFETKDNTGSIQITRDHANWLTKLLTSISISNVKTFTLQEVKESFESAGFDDFELFWDNKPMNSMYKFGLLVV